VDKNKIELHSPTKILRKYTFLFAKVLRDLRISPDALIAGRLLIFGLGSAYLFYIGTYVSNMLAVLFLFTNFFLGLIGEDLARNFNLKTKLSEFLDANSHYFINSIIIISITIYMFQVEHPLRFIGLFAFFGHSFSVKIFTFLKSTFLISVISENAKMEKFFLQNKPDLISMLLKELMIPKNFVFFLFSSIRYHLILGALLGIMPIMILLYAIMINFQWLTLVVALIYYYKFYNTEKRIIFFKALKALEVKDK